MNTTNSQSTTKASGHTLNKGSEGYVLLLFLLAPVVSFFISVWNFKYKNLRKFVVLFGGLYGLFYLAIPDSDATRYQTSYSQLGNYGFKDYVNDISNIASPDSMFPDMYVFTIFFIGKIFSDNPQFFHLITALVYFFVFVKLIGYIFDYDPNILKKSYGVFFISMIFMFGFSAGINGVRWPLGLIVFLLGTIRLLIENRIRYLLVAGLSVLIHFSFYPAFLALAAFYFVPFIRKPSLLFGFALFALIAGTVFSGFVFQNAASFGDVAESKLADYTREGYIEKRANNVSGWNSYVGVYRFGNYFFALAALAVMWIMRKSMITNKITNRLFAFAMLMAAMSFIANSIVDLSTNRYTAFVSFLTFTYLIFIGMLNPGNRTVRILMLCYAPQLMLNVFMTLRVEWDTISIYLMTNPFFALLQ